jgi:hypothetical protein
VIDGNFRSVSNKQQGIIASLKGISISHIIIVEITEVSMLQNLATAPKMIYSTKSKNPPFYFDVLLTVHLNIFISVFNQLDPQTFVLQ